MKNKTQNETVEKGTIEKENNSLCLDKSMPLLPCLIGEFLLLMICYVAGGAVVLVLTVLSSL